MSNKTLKFISIFSTIVGLGSTLLSNWVGEKKQKKEISEMVTKTLAEQLEKKGS